MTAPPAPPTGRGARLVQAMGDRALLVACADLEEVLALDAALRAAPLAGQRDLQPAERSLLVVLDGPRRLAAAAAALRSLRPPPRAAAGRRAVALDVVYDGPDVDDVARLTGLSPDAVVAAHAAGEWTAAFAGFAPGFVYLVGDFPPVPRRDSPRTAVPPGSVAVGGAYSAVYPRRSPGGWHLLGRTDALLWDASADVPALVRPGDVVTFRPVRAAATASAPAPAPTPRPATPGAAGPAGATGPRPGATTATLTVLSPGASTVVEDLGRPGRRDLGVAPGGAADRASARLANRLVGNARGAAVLETVLGGLTLRAELPAVVALTGAAPALEVERDGVLRERSAGAPVALAAGDVVRVAAPRTGLRSYLAVRGGVDAVPELGSRSRDVLAGLGPPPLVAGDAVAVGADVAGAVGEQEPQAAVVAADVVRLRAVPGPDRDLVRDAPGASLTGQDWVVSDAADRVGVRLLGVPLTTSGAGERPSAGVVAGAVQVPPSGEPVVFGVDHPVTGGYPVVAVVVDPDLDRLAQLRPGDRVRVVVDPAPGVDRHPRAPDAGEVRSSTRPARPRGTR
ncbi:5-oxoprolinase/urea amidolyase family protein [Actinotalea solisilvae]|uniref:5-oxoprolinase subunit B/C family protein n=1 Tax=Actinotalea solisilvae TaxID=2072922 RepID=UPI0027DE5BC6|nr:5-oxoprolinase/urea amidolyase family protein [Actinotalea solisilvae]